VRTHWRFGAWSMIPNSSEAGHGPWPMGDGCSSVSAVPAAVGATRNTSTSDWSSCSRWLGTAVAWGKTEDLNPRSVAWALVQSKVLDNIKWLTTNNRKEGWQANRPLFFDIILFVDTCLDAPILHARSMDLASASTKPPRILMS